MDEETTAGPAGPAPFIDFAAMKVDPPPQPIAEIREHVAVSISASASALAAIAFDGAGLAHIALTLDGAADYLRSAADQLRRHARQYEEAAAVPADAEEIAA